MQTPSVLALPAPDAASAAHSARLAAQLRERIGADCISFAEFMHEVLYAPGLGYYVTGTHKLGAGGDFMTAPEVSSLFGAVLARQCRELLAGMPGGQILEIGAGSGRLAVDLLEALAADGEAPHYRILEVSADLAARQRKRIGQSAAAAKVEWLDALPRSFRGVVIANEVLDAMPVERFRKKDGRVEQACVACTAGGFAWHYRPAPARLAGAVAAIEADLGAALPDGYVSELSLAAGPWLRDLGAALDQAVVLLFDYGLPRREYYAPDRRDGWLRCHYQHRAHSDPLILPGIQDVTTWVDFSAVASAAVDGGLEILGFAAQAQFLLGGGLAKVLDSYSDLPDADRLRLSGEVKTLTLPGEMGEHFKCIALGRGDVSVPSAFHLADRTAML